MINYRLAERKKWEKLECGKRKENGQGNRRKKKDTSVCTCVFGAVIGKG
jgi:hypothetical protein